MDVRDAAGRLLANRLAVFGLIFVGVVVLGALLAPLLAPSAPETMDATARLAPPSLAHPFGTDDFGRDLLSRVLYGARISLQVGLIAIAVSTLLGLVVGLVAGYARGWVDSVVMRVMDVVMAFPSVLLALFIMAALGSSLRNVVIAVSAAYIPFFARITRGQVLTLVETPFVEASRAAGASHVRLVVRHVFPNVIPLLIVQATTNLAFAVLAESSLSYLGLGTQPPDPSWGRMLTEARPWMNKAPWLSIFPGLALMALVIGSNLLGDGLRDALDPRLRGSTRARRRRVGRLDRLAEARSSVPIVADGGKT
jgi:peptide/nickel transport system permease protein